jgi:hypothetical protein
MVGTGTGSSTGKKLGLTGLTTGPQGMLGGVLTVAVARRRYLEPATETVRPIPTTYRPTYCFSNSTLSVDWSGMFLETIT